MWVSAHLHLVKPCSLGDGHFLPLSHLGETGKERGPTWEYSGQKVYSLIVPVYIWNFKNLMNFKKDLIWKYVHILSSRDVVVSLHRNSNERILLGQ